MADNEDWKKYDGRRPEPPYTGGGIPRAGTTATGWAVVEFGFIDVRSVSPTRRAAVVNWLVVNRSLMITNDMSDEDIERLWSHHSGRDAICVSVTIEVCRDDA